MFMCDERNILSWSGIFGIPKREFKRKQLNCRAIIDESRFKWCSGWWKTLRKFNTEPEQHVTRMGIPSSECFFFNHKNHLPKAISWEFHFSFLVNGSPLVVSWPMILSWLDYCMLMKRRKSMVPQQTSEWYWNHETVWPTDYKSRASSQKTSWMWFVPIVTA